MSGRKDSSLAEAIALGFGLVVVLAVGFWVHYAAPCSALDWLPVADIPARCLIGGR